MEVWRDCRRRCVACALVMFLAGCSKGLEPPQLADSVTVTGTVTLDGKPVEKATVRFAPIEEKGYRGAMGQTDESGKYELKTDIGNDKTKPGVIPGLYNVYVSKLVKPDGSIVPLNTNEPPMMSGARDVIPTKYNTDKGRLKFEVKPEGGTIDIKLTSK